MFKIDRLIEYCFYLFIFLLPWQTRWIWQDAFLNGFTWEYGRFSLYGTEILVGLILTVYLAWLWQHRRIRQLDFSNFFIKLQQPAVTIYWLVILLLLWAGLTIIGASSAS